MIYGRTLLLSKATADLELAVKEQAQLKTELAKTRRENKLDQHLLDSANELKKRAMTCKQEAQQAQDRLKPLLQAIGMLKSPISGRPLNSPIPDEEDGFGIISFRILPWSDSADIIEWPTNVKTVTGHNLWPLLADDRFKHLVWKLLRRCLLNISCEYGSRDYPVPLKPTYQNQNYHPWRAAWQDYANHPLLLLRCVTDQHLLESDVLLSTAEDDHIRLSFYAWKLLMISTVMKQRYEKTYDHDLRVTCFGSRGATRSSQGLHF
jgi:hypothetical protein